MHLGPELIPVLSVLVVFVFAVLAILFIIGIFYLRTLQTALNRVSPENRRMSPASVWLMLVPGLNILWQFEIAIHVPNSLRAEFQACGRDDGGDYGKSLAVTNSILGIATWTIGMTLSAIPQTGRLGELIGAGGCMVGLILFIVFWIKIASYSNLLALYNVQRERAWDHFDEEKDDDIREPKPDGQTDLPPDGFKAGDPGHYS